MSGPVYAAITAAIDFGDIPADDPARRESGDAVWDAVFEVVLAVFGPVDDAVARTRTHAFPTVGRA